LNKLASVILSAMMLLFTVAAVIAAENATHEVAEKESKVLDQVEKNTSVTQKVAEEAKETVTEVKEETTETATKAKEEASAVASKAKEEATGKEQPGFEATFALAGLLAVALIALNKKR
jgi:PGF-CTERM protein